MNKHKKHTSNSRTNLNPSQFKKIQVVKFHMKNNSVIFNLPDYLFHFATDWIFKKNLRFDMHMSDVIPYLFNPKIHKYFTYQCVSRENLIIFLKNPNLRASVNIDFTDKVGKIYKNAKKKACFGITKRILQEIRHYDPDFLYDLTQRNTRSEYVFYNFDEKNEAIFVYPTLSQIKLTKIIERSNTTEISFEMVQQQFFDVIPKEQLNENCQKALRSMIVDNEKIMYTENTDMYRLRDPFEPPKEKKKTRKEILYQNMSRLGIGTDEQKTEYIIHKIINCELVLGDILNSVKYHEYINHDKSEIKSNQKKEKEKRISSGDEDFLEQDLEENYEKDLEIDLSPNERENIKKYRRILQEIRFTHGLDWQLDNFLRDFIKKINNQDQTDLDKKLIEEFQIVRREKYIFYKNNEAELDPFQKQYVKRFENNEKDFSFY